MFVASKVLFLAFFDICRLRKGPQDIPESRNLLALGLVLYAICSCVLMSLSESFEIAALAAVLEVALLMIFTQALLQLKGKTSRWTQTVTALSGTGVILSLIAIPLYLMIGVGSTEEINADAGQGIGLMLLAFLACWNIAVMGHILRNALDINFAMAIFLSVFYILIIFNFTAAVMPIEAQ